MREEERLTQQHVASPRRQLASALLPADMLVFAPFAPQAVWREEGEKEKIEREIVLKVSGHSQKIHHAEKFLPTQVLSQEFLCQPTDRSGILSCRFSNKYFWHTFFKYKPQVCMLK